MDGCSLLNHQMGTRITDRQLLSVTKGQTTTVIHISSFGTLDKTLNSGEDTMYIYDCEVIKSIGRNIHKTVTFLCDRNGIVKDYTAKRKGGTLLRAA